MQTKLFSGPPVSPQATTGGFAVGGFAGIILKY